MPYNFENLIILSVNEKIPVSFMSLTHYYNLFVTSGVQRKMVSNTHEKRRFCLFVLRFNVPVSHVGREPPLPGYYQSFRGVKCLAQGHGGDRFRTPTSRSGVRRSTTEPPRSPQSPVVSTVIYRKMESFGPYILTV